MADETRKSLKIEVGAEDKASASVEKISRRMLDDMARLDRQIFNAGATAKQRELRDLDEHMAKLRQRYEGNAAMQAKIAEAAAAQTAAIQRKYDEASAKTGGGMGGFGRLLSMGVAMSAARAGVAAINADMASMAFEAAAATGSVNEMYGALNKAREATKQIAASIPFIGGALSTAMSLLGDSPGVEKAVKSIDKVKADSEKLIALAKSWGDELEIAAAKARGATEDELGRLGRKQKQAGRESAIADAEARLAEAKRKLNDAEYARAQADRIAREESARARFSVRDVLLSGGPYGLIKHAVQSGVSRYRAAGAKDDASLDARAAQELGAEVQKQQKALDEARAAAAKLAEAEAEQARREAAEKAKAAEKAVTEALMSEEDKRLAAASDRWAEVRKLAAQAWTNQADLEKRLTEITKAEEAERARIKADFARLAAEKERQIQEHAANEIKDFMRMIEAEARERERAASEAARARQEKAAITEDLLRNMGFDRLAGDMARKRRFDNLREKYAEDPGMLAVINASEQAERNRPAARMEAFSRSAPSFAGTESRFLSRAPGRDAGAELVSETKTQTQTLEAALKSLPANIAAQVKAIINVGVL